MTGRVRWLAVVLLLVLSGCTGLAERDFTLARGQLGYTVVEMSGPARDQP